MGRVARSMRRKARRSRSTSVRRRRSSSREVWRPCFDGDFGDGSSDRGRSCRATSEPPASAPDGSRRSRRVPHVLHASSCILMRSRRSFQFVVIRGSKQTCGHASVAGRTVDRPPRPSSGLPSKSPEFPDRRPAATVRALELPVAGLRFHRGRERGREQAEHGVSDAHAVRLPSRARFRPTAMARRRFRPMPVTVIGNDVTRVHRRRCREWNRVEVTSINRVSGDG